MAMTMTDNVNRKACDRCHSQKLSCKRVGDGPCERCHRLHTECKSSPSLRYKKQQQQQQHHQQQQQQHAQSQHNHNSLQPRDVTPISARTHQSQKPHQQQQHMLGDESAASAGRHSPKRRRMGNDLDLVQPDAVPPVPPVPQQYELGSKNQNAVVPDTHTLLDLGDFGFNLEPLDFFSVSQPEHLSQQPIPVRFDQIHLAAGNYSGSWEAYHQQQTQQQSLQHQHQHQNLTAETSYPQVTLGGPLARLETVSVGGDTSGRINSALPSRRRPTASAHQGSPDKRHRQRGKSRPRQIALRQIVSASAKSRDIPSAHWMAQLSEINSRLLDLSSALRAQQSDGHNGGSMAKNKGHGFPIDEMFQLTRRVADILDRLCTTSASKDVSLPSGAMLDSSDPGNSMFVLSIYIRLLDMYQKVFSLVRNELSSADAGSAFLTWKLPDVTIGSFAVESSPSLQMSLTIQLAEEFLSRLRCATAALDPALTSGVDLYNANAPDKNVSSMFSEVVDISYRALKSKEDSLGKHLSDLRDEIDSFLDM